MAGVVIAVACVYRSCLLMISFGSLTSATVVTSPHQPPFEQPFPAFSAIGTTGRFVPFDGLANVVLEGRVYHRLLDLADGGHSMHWFLYDETERRRQASALDVPAHMVAVVRSYLDRVSPYVHSLRHAVQEVADDAEPLAVKLRIPPAGGEIAAVVNTDNLRQVQARQVVFFRRGGLPPRFVPVLSCQIRTVAVSAFIPARYPGLGFAYRRLQEFSLFAN